MVKKDQLGYELILRIFAFGFMQNSNRFVGNEKIKRGIENNNENLQNLKEQVTVFSVKKLLCATNLGRGKHFSI